MFLAFLAIVSATFSPAEPTVGDLITVEFAETAKLDRSPAFEIVSERANGAVIRTFTPEPVMLSGTVGAVRFRNLPVPIKSVLKENDDLKPAPLAPPRSAPMPRMPFWVMGAVAAVAAVVWALVFRFARRPIKVVVPSVSPEVVFRRAVVQLRARPVATRWAELADATRRYLAASRAQLSSDLTTKELVPRLAEKDRVVADILRQGDLEKFSETGAYPLDFDTVAARALELIPVPVEVSQ